MKKFGWILGIVFVLGSLAPSSLSAQDPTKVDPKHYTVVFENDKVRVIHIAYGPGEKSVMHYHPEGVAIFLTDAKASFLLPGGKVVKTRNKAGDVVWAPAGKHQPKNLGDSGFELYQIEMK
ncbi:MAG: cytoplasmic protein [Calditrichaeota bacterium]|nr:MAG: cytoplasmic protein [Calditrichota bacterium]